MDSSVSASTGAGASTGAEASASTGATAKSLKNVDVPDLSVEEIENLFAAQTIKSAPTGSTAIMDEAEMDTLLRSLESDQAVQYSWLPAWAKEPEPRKETRFTDSIEDTTVEDTTVENTIPEIAQAVHEIAQTVQGVEVSINTIEDSISDVCNQVCELSEEVKMIQSQVENANETISMLNQTISMLNARNAALIKELRDFICEFKAARPA